MNDGSVETEISQGGKGTRNLGSLSGGPFLRIGGGSSPAHCHQEAPAEVHLDLLSYFCGRTTNTVEIKKQLSSPVLVFLTYVLKTKQ